MSRRRYLSTNISLDKRINQLAVEYGDFAALLYTWMIPHAGDDATLTADPDELLATVAPMRRDKTAEDIEAALYGMEFLGLIERNREGGYIAFPAESYYKYQSYIKGPRRGANNDAAPESPSEGARQQAQYSAQNGASPQSHDDQRKSAQNVASFSSSLKSSLTNDTQAVDTAAQDIAGTLPPLVSDSPELDLYDPTPARNPSPPSQESPPKASAKSPSIAPAAPPGDPKLAEIEAILAEHPHWRAPLEEQSKNARGTGIPYRLKILKTWLANPDAPGVPRPPKNPVPLSAGFILWRDEYGGSGVTLIRPGEDKNAVLQAVLTKHGPNCVEKVHERASRGN